MVLSHLIEPEDHKPRKVYAVAGSSGCGGLQWETLIASGIQFGFTLSTSSEYLRFAPMTRVLLEEEHALADWLPLTPVDFVQGDSMTVVVSPKMADDDEAAPADDEDGFGDDDEFDDEEDIDELDDDEDLDDEFDEFDDDEFEEDDEFDDDDDDEDDDELDDDDDDDY